MGDDSGLFSPSQRMHATSSSSWQYGDEGDLEEEDANGTGDFEEEDLLLTNVPPPSSLLYDGDLETSPFVPTELDLALFEQDLRLDALEQTSMAIRKQVRFTVTSRNSKSILLSYSSVYALV